MLAELLRIEYATLQVNKLVLSVLSLVVLTDYMQS